MPEDMLIRLPEYVNPKILDRGLDYFRNDFIAPPERVSEHKWVARAMGRRVYEVSLTFNPEGDDEWHCDCPFEGPVCKHVVAACFAVLQVAGDTYPGVARSGDLQKLPAFESRLIIEQLFEVLDKEELITFLRGKLKQDHHLASVFESEFLYRLPEHQKSARYRRIVSKEVRSAFNNRQFAEYPEYRDFEDMDMLSDQLMDQTDWLLDLSKKHREENSPTDMRTWLKKLIFDDYRHMKWFREYKKTWPEAEWPREREKIIAKQKKRKDVFHVDHFLAEIYVEEKLFDRLEEMLRDEAGIMR